jgi:hypothetical protein
MTSDRALAEVLRAVLSRPENWSLQAGVTSEGVVGYTLRITSTLVVDGSHARALNEAAAFK